MKRSNLNTCIPYQDEKRTKSTNQGPANDGGNFKNEFEAFYERLSIKSESYDSKEISAGHRLSYLTDNHFSNDAEKVVIPAVKETKSTYQKLADHEGNFKNEYEALSGRFSVKTEPYDPEQIPTSHRLSSLTDHNFSNNAGKVISAVKETKSTYKRYANHEGNFENEYEALSGRFSVKTEPYDPEQISFSHQLSCLTDPHFSINAEKVVIPAVKETNSAYQRPVHHEGNLNNEYEALSGRFSVKIEPYEPEQISTSHRLSCLTGHHFSNNTEKIVIPAVRETNSTYRRPAYHEDNFKEEYEALSGRPSVKTKPYEPEQISISNGLSYLTDNRFSNNAENVITPTVKEIKYTYQRPAQDESNFNNEYEAISGRFPVKTELYDPGETSTSHRLSYLPDNHFSNDAEKSVIPTVGPPPIMIKISNFDARLKLFIEKFDEIGRKKVGIFIKLCPETYDMHWKLLSFMEANNIQYKIPRKIRVFITGLPCYIRPQQIKDALIEKGFDVEEIVQVTEYRTKKPLPLFQATLPNSDGNKNIYYLANILNISISVGSMRTGKLRSHAIKSEVKSFCEKDTVKSIPGVPKWVKFFNNPEIISWESCEEFQKFSNDNFRQPRTTHTHMARRKRRRNRRYFQ